MIKLIVGLGNIGSDYKLNRHNVGFWMVDTIAVAYNGIWKKDAKFFGNICKINVDGVDIILLKPAIFMNKSGQSISSIIKFFKITAEQVIVAHDELDIPLENIKFKKSGGHGGHNGLRDIINHIGRDFYRVRIGIGRPTNGMVANFVLKNPSTKEQNVIIENIIKFMKLLPDFVCGNFDKATQKLHT